MHEEPDETVMPHLELMMTPKMATRPAASKSVDNLPSFSETEYKMAALSISGESASKGSSGIADASKEKEQRQRLADYTRSNAASREDLREPLPGVDADRRGAHKKTWSNLEGVQKDRRTAEVLNTPLHEERLAVSSPRTRYLRLPGTVEYEYVKDETRRGEYGPLVSSMRLEPQIICDYRILKTIGSGSTGKVKLAEHVRTGKRVAIKIVPRLLTTRSQKSKESIVSRERRILREAAILFLAEHPGIVRLHDFLVTEDCFCLFFEHIDGKELLDHIVDKGRLSERRAKSYFAQLLSIIAYCHANGIVHRDLKIENILITRLDVSDPTVKLVDFGLSNFYHPRQRLTTYCGSLYFAAPELLSGKPYCGPEVDIWSLGVILYVMLCGKVPFDDKSLSVLHGKIKQGVFAIPSYVSAPARDVLHSMLTVDPAARIRIPQLMNTAWMRECLPRFYPERNMPIDVLDERVVDHLCSELAPLQFGGAEGVRSVLERSLTDWPTVHDHPLVKLYHLTRHRLASLPRKAIGEVVNLRPSSEGLPLLDKEPLAPPTPLLYRMRSASFVLPHRTLALHHTLPHREQERPKPRLNRSSKPPRQSQKGHAWRCTVQ